MMELVVLLAATAFSTLGTLAGFGGGIFIVPLLVLVMKAPLEIAIGVTAISLFPASVVASLFNLRSSTIDFRLLIALEIPAMIGAYLGAHLTGLMPTRPLEMAFSAFLIFMAWSMIRKPKGGSQESQEDYQYSLWATTIGGGGAGVIAGLFGIGGGILKTPLMIRLFKVPPRIATATSTATIMFTSLSSGVTHYNLGHVDINLLVPCMAGFTLGGIIGGMTGVKLKDDMIRRVIGVSMVLAALAVVFF